jgi:hypothetical protein
MEKAWILVMSLVPWLELPEQFQQVQMTKLDERLVDMQMRLSNGMQMGNSLVNQSCWLGPRNN